MTPDSGARKTRRRGLEAEAPEGDRNKNLVGARVRVRRQELHLTLAELSVKIRNVSGHALSPQTLHKIEVGARGVQDYEFRALAQALDTSYASLLD